MGTLLTVFLYTLNLCIEPIMFNQINNIVAGPIVDTGSATITPTANNVVSVDVIERRITTPSCTIDNVCLGAAEAAGYDSIEAWYNIKAAESGFCQWQSSDQDSSFMRVSNYTYIHKNDDESITWRCNVPLTNHDGHYNIGFKATFKKVNTEWIIDYDEIANNLVPHQCEFVSTPTTMSRRMREIIHHRMAPAIGRRRGLGTPQDNAEIAARQTLHRVIGETQFRRFLKFGHVSVRAKSGMVYQLFPGHNMTKVYMGNKCLERLCVVLPSGFPPTDSLIMRYLLVLNDEREFRRMANVSPCYGYGRVDDTIDINRSLADIYREVKSNMPYLEVA